MPSKSPAYREVDGAYIKKPASPPAIRLPSEAGNVLPPDPKKIPRICGRSITPHHTTSISLTTCRTSSMPTTASWASYFK